MIINSNIASSSNLPIARVKGAVNKAPADGANQAHGQIAVDENNFISADPQIQDVDSAKESAERARESILEQSATAMLAQARSMPQSALLLLQQ